MMFRRSRRCEPMPTQFNELAYYNTRKHNGVVHDSAYAERMALLQAEFDQWRREANAREGIITVPGTP